MVNRDSELSLMPELDSVPLQTTNGGGGTHREQHRQKPEGSVTDWLRGCLFLCRGECVKYNSTTIFIIGLLVTVPPKSKGGGRLFFTGAVTGSVIHQDGVQT